eukprot:TRINITY_DN2295_c0_g1_i1.p1 TRINITY_DN2295_c0_g1~~TRINITY_DN2295_c0_g1_i1.p1  ORF type:complete len:533 (+),score=162.41 TRINITY_DN2295_c0_g1_i1:29-1627(+)
MIFSICRTLILSVLIIQISSAQFPLGANPEILVDLVNDYRVQNGLSRVPFSQSLMTVGQYHATAMSANDVSCTGCASDCGMHSWPPPTTPNLWVGCCFPRNNSNPTCMWNKPQEITSSWSKPYPSEGFENGAFMYGTPTTGTEAQILANWKASSPHNSVILNIGAWSMVTWNAIGSGMYYNPSTGKLWAYLWFGMDVDSNTYTRVTSSPSTPVSPPTKAPTVAPTLAATKAPTITPTPPPTAPPTRQPTAPPTASPTVPPTPPPTVPPTKPPTAPPTDPPTMPPTKTPTVPPTVPPKPPTPPPTNTPTVPPTNPPTVPPTKPPTPPPTNLPTVQPTVPPTNPPTRPPPPPTKPPSLPPTRPPTAPPTNSPTVPPTVPPTSPTSPTPIYRPPTKSLNPVSLTDPPTDAPTYYIPPTDAPTSLPTEEPTDLPVALPETLMPTPTPTIDAPTYVTPIMDLGNTVSNSPSDTPTEDLTPVDMLNPPTPTPIPTPQSPEELSPTNQSWYVNIMYYNVQSKADAESSLKLNLSVCSHI